MWKPIRIYTLAYIENILDKYILVLKELVDFEEFK